MGDQSTERRRAHRTETNVQLSARIPARPCRAVIHDLSPEGCRIEVGNATIELGGTALLDLPGYRGFPGRVVWVRGNEAGIRFSRRLAGPPAVALGIEEPEPEPEIEETEAPQQNLGGLLRHWMRRLTGRRA